MGLTLWRWADTLPRPAIKPMSDHRPIITKPTMPSIWFASFLVFAALTAGQVALVFLSLWEGRRFAISRLRRPAKQPPPRQAALFVPCKGIETGLEENLRPLFEQDYPNYSLTLIVESADDPACGPIRRLIAQRPNVSARLFVAGQAHLGGQKVHNLREATAGLADDVEILAFVDSDARPRSNWLSQIVERLGRAEVGAVTGYRWFVPERGTVSNLLSYSINSGIAAGVGPGGHHLVWGGSWAIRRDAFDALRMRDAWRGTLSDDLVATRVLHRAKLRIEFQPACMLASPLDNNWRQTIAFLRRQYVIARFYAPQWWLLAFAAASLPLLTFWGGLALLAASWACGDARAWLPALVCPAFYASTVFRGLLRSELARLYLPEHQAQLATAFRFDHWAGPLVQLVNWMVMFSSLFGNRLKWRGIEYRILRDGQVRIVRRHDACVIPPSEPAPANCPRRPLESRPRRLSTPTSSRAL